MVNLSLKFNVNPIVFLQDIAANRNTRMLSELLMEVKQMSRDIQFIKTEMAKFTLNPPGAGPEPQREENFPIVLPLTNEEKFDEAETALKEESVRRKMVNCELCIFLNLNVCSVGGIALNKCLTWACLSYKYCAYS